MRRSRSVSGRRFLRTDSMSVNVLRSSASSSPRAIDSRCANSASRSRPSAAPPTPATIHCRAFPHKCNTRLPILFDSSFGRHQICSSVNRSRQRSIFGRYSSTRNSRAQEMNLSVVVVIGVDTLFPKGNTREPNAPLRTLRPQLCPDAACASLCAAQAARLHPALHATEDAPAVRRACECCQTQAAPVSSSSVENFVSPYPASTQIFAELRDASAAAKRCQQTHLSQEDLRRSAGS